ncbi:MAG: tRNA pseudouridine(38-40) synthase TruA [Spirochaetota bacterium]
MATIRLTIEYDGTDYAGWQVQDNARTIQGEIEAVLARMYKRDVRLTGSGRTDSGVHALGQVAHYAVDDLSVPVERLPLALNYHLESDIRVIDAAIAPDGFHARYSAVSRSYVYMIHNSPISSAFYRRYSWLVPAPRFDIRRLNAYADRFLGTHNFTSFCSLSDKSRSKIRKIKRASFTRRGDMLYFFIEADAFLHNMVRIVLGTILSLYRDTLPPETVDEIMLAEDRKRADITVPPQGLFLKRVTYGER